MHPENRKALEARVVRAAEAALARHQYVSPIDVLTGMGLLAPTLLFPRMADTVSQRMSI